MGFVDHHQLPRDNHKLVSVTGGKLVGANDDVVLLKRAADADLRHLVIVSSFQNSGWQEELLFDFLRPLFAQICRRDDKDASLALRPFLGKH